MRKKIGRKSTMLAHFEAKNRQNFLRGGTPTPRRGIHRFFPHQPSIFGLILYYFRRATSAPRGSARPKKILLDESIDLDELYPMVLVSRIFDRRLNFGARPSEVARPGALHQYAAYL